MLTFATDVLEAIRRDALARYPEEACGLVVRDPATGAVAYEPYENVADDPRERFAMPVAASRRFAEAEVLAVVHSHPDGPDHPSADDQRDQLAHGVPYGLCVVRHGVAERPFFWGAGAADDVPYLRRDFRWGPTGTDGKGDCLALVRDWYRRERGLDIPDTPRDAAWQQWGPDLYQLGWQKNGFRIVNFGDLQEGDAVLFALQSGGRPNHAGVITRRGRVLHHLQNRLSIEAPLVGDLRKSAVLFLRPPERLP